MKQTYTSLLMILLVSDIYSQGVPEVEIDNGFVVDYGNTFTINCSTSAKYQITRVYWQKSSNGIVSQLEAGLAGTKGMNILNPSLTINFASMTDSGIYTCFAINSFGLGKSNSVNITVHGGLPVINTPKTKYTVIYGNSIKMECIVEAFPELNHVNWKRNTSGILTILNDGAVGTGGIKTNNPSLTIEYTTLADAGIYQCSVSNMVGTETSEVMYLTVIGGVPMVTIPLANYSSNYGKEVTIECSVAAIPDVIKIFWSKSVNGERTTINAGTLGTRGSIVDNPSLTIMNATITDFGGYTCFAENKVGIGMSRATYLNIHGGIPDVRIGALAYNAVFGSKIYLYCDVTAEPEHTLVYWERKRNGLISTINFQAIGTTGITPNTPSLTLQFSLFSDIGSYTCVAANAIGIGQSHPTIVTVSGDVPVAIIRKKRYMANYGDQVTLQCSVTSIPIHNKLYWKKSNEGSVTNITAEYQGISGANLTHPSLTIQFVTQSDAGLYTCIAINAIGIGKSSECNMTVIADTPLVSIEKNIQTAFVGLSFEIQCSIQSIPMYTYVYWTRSKNATITVLVPGTVGYEGMTAQNPNLFIPKVDIFMDGEYRCLAVNELGTGQSLSTNLTVEYDNEALDVSTTHYETIQHKEMTESNILSTEGTLGHETNTKMTESSKLSTLLPEEETRITKTQFSNAETTSTNEITTEEIYVTEADGVDKSDNSSKMYTDNDNGISTGAVVGIVITTLVCLVAIFFGLGLGLLYKIHLKEKCYRDGSRSFNYPDGRHLQANQDGNMFLQRKRVEQRLHPINMDKPQVYQASSSSQSGGLHNDLNQDIFNSSKRDGSYSYSRCSKCHTLHNPDDSCDMKPFSSDRVVSAYGNDKTFDSRYNYRGCKKCHKLHRADVSCNMNQ